MTRTTARTVVWLLVSGLATIAAAGDVTLNWTDNSDNEDGFYIERSVGTVMWELRASVGPDVTEYVDSGLVSGETYRYRVNAYNEYGTSTFTNTIEYLHWENQPPMISALQDLVVSANAATDPIAFDISDADTAAADLLVTARSSNSALVSESGISLSGADGARFVTISPMPDAHGTVVVTLTVSDGDLETSTSFELVVEEPIAASLEVVSITSGYSGLVPNGVAVEASVSSDNFGAIKAVEYVVNGVPVATSVTYPFTAQLLFDDEGAFEVVAIATLVDGQRVSSAGYTVNVGPEPVDEVVVSNLRSGVIGDASSDAADPYSQIDDAFILQTTGSGVSDGGDSLYYSHLRVLGDSTLAARLSPLVDAELSAAAGLMMRDGLQEDAAHIAVVLDEAGKLRLLMRLEMSGSATDEVLASGIGGNVFVRLVRVGNSVRVERSSDGFEWQLLAQRNISLGDMYLAGLTMSDASGASTAFVDRVVLDGAIVSWDDLNAPPATPSGLDVSDLASN